MSNNTSKQHPFINTLLYCVTDHNVILEVSVDQVTPLDGYPELQKFETSLTSNNDLDYAECHHDTYFKKMHLRNGKVDKGNVFENKKEAAKFALEYIEEKENSLQRELERLAKKKASLKEIIND